MTHKSKPDWCVFAGILAAAAALLLHVGYWIAGPVLLILLLCAYPQSYEIAAKELVIHDSLTRRRIPYGAILSAQSESGRLRISYGLASEIVIAPAHPQQFLQCLEDHAPHLARRGGELVLRDRYVAYSFSKPRGAWRVS